MHGEIIKFIQDYFKYVHHKLKDRNQNLYTTVIKRKTCHFEILLSTTNVSKRTVNCGWLGYGKDS